MFSGCIVTCFFLSRCDVWHVFSQSALHPFFSCLQTVCLLCVLAETRRIISAVVLRAKWLRWPEFELLTRFFHATSILTFISSGKVDWAHTLHFFINYTPKLSCPVKPVLFCMLFSLACTQGTLRVFYWEVQVTLINMSHPSISILSNFPWSKFQGYQVILV